MKSIRKIFLILSLFLPATVLFSGTSYAQTELEASIFSYDGKNFVRNQTTLTEEGETAAGTKLDSDSAAHKALVQKRSHTGTVNVFGRDLEAHYAPLIDENGQLTGAIAVGVPK